MEVSQGRMEGMLHITPKQFQKIKDLAFDLNVFGWSDYRWIKGLSEITGLSTDTLIKMGRKGVTEIDVHWEWETCQSDKF